jgi:hypothetical protein
MNGFYLALVVLIGMNVTNCLFSRMTLAQWDGHAFSKWTQTRKYIHVYPSNIAKDGPVRSLNQADS